MLNGYVGPIISRYMAALTERLDGLRFGGVLLIMQSNGGVATPAEVSRRAALSLLSGPAAGPTAASSTCPGPASPTASPSTWAARASTSRWSRTGGR